MSPRIKLPTMPLKVIKVVEQPRAWTTRVTWEGDFLFTSEDSYRYQVDKNAADFFRALLSAHTPEEVRSFLDEYGHPGINEMVYVGTQDLLFGGEPKTFRQRTHQPRSRIFLSEITELHQLLDLAMRTPTDEWKFDLFDPQELTFQIEPKKDALLGVCRINNGVEACLAVIYLEKLLEQVERGWCAICGRSFRKESFHNRKYCDANCAHSAAVKAFRKRRQDQRKAIRDAVFSRRQSS